MIADLRLALRQFARAPGHSLTIVTILALGIGANAAIFSLLYSVLLNPLPYPAADQLVLAWQRDHGTRDISVSWPNGNDWRTQNTTFSSFALYQRNSYTLTGRGAAERVGGAAVTADYFRAVGLPTLLGRFFTTDEDRVGGPNVAVISHRLWQTKFGGAESVLGQSLELDGKSYTIIGVTPPQWALPRNSDVRVPLTPSSSNTQWQDRSVGPGLYAFGRVKPGVTLEQARAELRTISDRIAAAFPDKCADTSAFAQSLLDASVGSYRAPLWFLMGAVGLLLLIACANVAGLQLARAIARARDYSIRAALGSSRARLLRQQLVESLVFAAIGGALGILLAVLCLGIIRGWSPDVARFQQVSINLPVLAFSVIASGLASVLAGLWPAWRASRTDVRAALASGGNSGTAPAAQRGRQFVVGAQVALTLMLLAGALLFARSLAHIARFQYGFDPANLLVFRVDLPEARPAYDTPVKRVAFLAQLRDELAALPGVKSAAYNVSLPFRAQWQSTFEVEGRPAFAPGAAPSAEMGFADENYFKTLGIPILRGRSFGAEDKLGSAGSIIIDQSFADRIWPGENPLGKAILWGGDLFPGGKLRVVGVVPTVELNGFTGGPHLIQVYLANAQFGASSVNFVLRTDTAPRALVESVRAAVSRLGSDLAVYDVATMDEMIGASASTERLSARLVSLFGGAALLLSAIGLYGIVAYAVRARQREIGVRLAIGAQPRQVIALVFRQGATPLVWGLALGLAGAFATGRFVQSMLYQTQATDPLALAASALGLAAIAALALWLPARRAARVDPMKALRTD
jgi:predicted permease